MDRLEQLEKKVLQAVEQLTTVKEECVKLRVENQFLESENKRIQELIRENDVLRDEKKTIAARIERVLRKLKTVYAQV